MPLNNDTRVQAGWLSALVTRAAGAPDIGIVAPMLLYPDGVLQEAGSIVFSDATGWNFGRGQRPESFEFNYVRDVDYASGACLLVRAELWRELGGYDELYLPMYYEDADLCFAARERGYRTVYEPASRVVHVEGGTAGTDAGAGGKRHQELNRPKFAQKWAQRLAAEQLPSAPDSVRRASDRNRGPGILVVDHRVPFPDRDAGSVRMAQMLGVLVDLGCRVTSSPTTSRRPSPTRASFRRSASRSCTAPWTSARCSRRPAPSSRSRSSAALRSPLATSSRSASTRRRRCWRTTRSTCTSCARSVRGARRRPPRQGGHDARDRARARPQCRRHDRRDRERAPDGDVARPGRPRGDRAVREPRLRCGAPPHARSGLLFVGGFEHPPNTGAAVTLVRDMMPLVWRELGPVPVTIVGADPPAEVRELAGPEVDVAGWVDDLRPLYDTARVMVAPLHYGAGMKGKVTQSLAAGLPIVTTAVGAEGLGAVDGRDMLIAEDPAGLAAAVVRLVRDDDLWSELSRAD